MVTINKDLAIERQIDRACAAQSSEMLPQLPPSPEEAEARKQAFAASINAKFSSVK